MAAILTLHNPARAAEYYGAGYWRKDTLYSLLQHHAAVRPNQFALRDSHRRLTWGQLSEWVDLVAFDLHQAGLKAGQRVSVWLPNRAETVVVTLACSRNGYICNPSLHQSYTVADVVDLLTRIQSVVLFAQQGFGADADRRNIVEAAYQVATIKRVYRLKPVAEAGSPNLGAGTASVAAQSAPVGGADKIVLLAFTSGTTGEPKGVMHSDNTLLANARAMAADWRHHEAIVLLSMSPLTHAIGTIAMAQALVSGFELVLNDVPKGKTTLDWVHETGATYIMGVPTHAIDVLAETKRRGYDRLGKVSVFYMGGSAIPRETVRALLDLGITPQNVYGMTENGAHQYTLPDDDTQAIVETCGRACAGYEVRIWSQEDPDVEVARGEIGEIGGRGACLTLGYFDNQNATEQSFNRYGWVPAGGPGGGGGRGVGEKVCLAVVPQDAAGIDPQMLLRHLHERGLSTYDMPEYFVAVDAFPLTPSGKILKRELVEGARAGRIKPRSGRW